MNKHIYNLLERLGAILLLLLLLPLFIVIALLIIIEDGFPVFFIQERIGKNGKIFKLFKFRSMINHIDKGFICTSDNDNRITKIGKFIRKTRIDELPQIINIITGSMSFVGVRPDIMSHFEYYNNLEKEEYCKNKPGIYGLAAYVYKNESSILKDVDNKKEFYLKYLLHEKCILNKIYNDNKSILLDINILLASFKLKKHIKIKNKSFKIINNIKEIINNN